MNYLAHAVLSFSQPDILAGNMISDFVKGNKKFDYPQGIQKGMILHRAIDEYTDNHPVTTRAKQIFRPAYRLYAGAFMDVVYDHFLALDVNEFKSSAALETFCNSVYQTLGLYNELLPENFQKILPYMQLYNWLYNYRFEWGIEKAFAGLQRRAKYIEETNTAFILFNENYTELKLCYIEFFPQLKNFAVHQLSELNKS